MKNGNKHLETLLVEKVTILSDELERFSNIVNEVLLNEKLPNEQDFKIKLNQRRKNISQSNCPYAVKQEKNHGFIKKNETVKRFLKNDFFVFVIGILAIISIISSPFDDSKSAGLDEISPVKTRYVVENLKGDTVDTWKSWRLVDTSMTVNVINTIGLPEKQIDIIKDAITSEKILEVDDSISHKGPKGQISTYFTGWQGALKNTQGHDTLYNLPTEFNVIKSDGREGNVIINLSNLKDSDGYTGYTKSVVDGNEILKSFIMIYDVSNLTDEQLATIVRHEFGHALGLGHSTAPEDLMAPTIDMTVPYISECNIEAIVALYQGEEMGEIECSK